MPVSPKIHFAALIPPFELKTEVARGALPEEYSRRDAVYNLSRSALMTAALFSGSLENLRVAVQDRLHQPYRMKFIPGFETVIRMSYELGSLGTYLSGAGPTMISIVDDEGVKIFREHAVAHMEEMGISGWRLFRSLRAVLTLRKRIPRRNPHHPQLLPLPQMHRAAEIFLRWIRT